MKSCTLLSLLVALTVVVLPAQEKLIHLENPSFEGDEPQDATVPASWHPCQQGTTPDILPGVWGVFLEPAEGETFVGLITRSDGTWESIGQRLSAPLKPKECYNLVIDLAKGDSYAGYNQPIKLRVWGGGSKCSPTQLLVESDYIDHDEWETYKFLLVPRSSIHYLIFEAYHGEEGETERKGNIMMDNVQPLEKCIRAALPLIPQNNRG